MSTEVPFDYEEVEEQLDIYRIMTGLGTDDIEENTYNDDQNIDSSGFVAT